MARTVGIGYQNYKELIEMNAFYIDKTLFIKEWWENLDKVTLITRPPAVWQNAEYEHGGTVLFGRLCRSRKAV